MTVKTDAQGQLAPTTPKPAEMSLSTLLVKMQPEITRAVPKHLSPERLARVALTALRTVPMLDQCTPASFFASVFSAAQLGIEVNTPLGHAWLIPRRNNRLRGPDGKEVWEATLMVGYQGLKELAYRSQLVTSIAARAVRLGDLFEYSLGSEFKVRHVPSSDPQRLNQPVTHAWATLTLKGGGVVGDVLSLPEIEARRARSAASQRGPWVTDYEAMCAKTAFKAGAKWAPQSADLARALAVDEAAESGVPLAHVVDPEALVAMKQQGLAWDEETGEVKE